MPLLAKLEDAYYDVLSTAATAALDRREQLLADATDEVDEAVLGTASMPHACARRHRR